MRVNREALQLHVVYKKQYFMLQVTQESISGTISHARIYIKYYKSYKNLYQVLQVTCAASEYAMKLNIHMIKSLSHSIKLYWKKYHSFVALGIVTRAAHS